MTTNQTIDGVPRELIGKAMLACFEAGFGIPHGELRALLEAPAAPSKFVGAAQYWVEHEQALRDVCRFEGLKGLVYQVARDCAKPTAQTQGEPVAIVDEGDDGLFIEFIYGENGNPLQRGSKLYAEPPSPVAVVRMCDCNQGRLPCRCRPIPAGIESLAQQIYQSWESQPGFVPWVDGGNSTKQDEARQIASRTFELALANQVGD